MEEIKNQNLENDKNSINIQKLKKSSKNIKR
jgi:hypothetical protein